MKISCKIIEVLTRTPFVSSARIVTTVRQILVQVQWEGLTGLGATVLAVGDRGSIDACLDVFLGASPFELELILNRCEAILSARPGVLAAVDMALHDLLGKALRQPLHRMWGLEGLPLPPTAIGIGVMSERERVERALSFSRWPIVKLKLGHLESYAVVARIRDVYAGRIWVDVNGSLDVNTALALAERLQRYDVELFEQPIPAGEPELLRYIRERSPIPIVADEDCAGPEDLLRLQGCADVVNIKFVKCGGYRRGIEMIRLARRLGFEVMLGCKVESVLGVTAIAQLASLAKYLDLDGHLHLADDPFFGIEVEAGVISLPARHGHGGSAVPERDLRDDDRRTN